MIAAEHLPTPMLKHGPMPMQQITNGKKLVLQFSSLVRYKSMNFSSVTEIVQFEHQLPQELQCRDHLSLNIDQLIQFKRLFLVHGEDE